MMEIMFIGLFVNCFIIDIIVSFIDKGVKFKSA